MMTFASLFQVALLLSTAEESWGRSSLRTRGKSESSTVAFEPCSCDCCLVQQEYHAAFTQNADSLTCAPKSGARVPGGAAGTGTDGCANICMLPADMRGAFKSESGEADYTRYCTEMCGPATSTLNDLCVDRADIDDRVDQQKRPGVAKQASTALATVAQKDSAMTQMGSRLTAEGSQASEEALLLLAKQKMEAAKLSAEAAGRSAYTARMAYERLKRTQQEMAWRAGEATLDEIKAEAAQTSKRARDARLAYVNGAQATAIKNALAGAKVYTDAMVRDLAVANTWQERAGQFAAAATQREQMAMDFSSEAELYRQRNQPNMAKEKLVMAHQAIDQAAAFGAQAEGAHKQAQAIANSKTWYEYAKQAFAAHMLAKSMPGDVPPPPMPALP